MRIYGGIYMNELLQFFRAINDETRLRLFSLLSERDHCVCELTEILALPQPKVSKHLAKLKDLGFVETKREGQFIYYHLSVSNEIIQEILAVITKHAKDDSVLAQDRQRISTCKAPLQDREVTHG